MYELVSAEKLAALNPVYNLAMNEILTSHDSPFSQLHSLLKIDYTNENTLSTTTIQKD